ncbi:MAG: hypothetical protein KDB26_05645 [Microthrixaceae bacterium]|nr:hypothetical protein [Microthrixaceae bacterium]
MITYIPTIDTADETFAPSARDAANAVRAAFPFNASASTTSPLVTEVRQWASEQGFDFPDDELNAFLDFVRYGAAYSYRRRGKERNPKRFSIIPAAWSYEVAKMDRVPLRVRGATSTWLTPRTVTAEDVQKVLIAHPKLTETGYGSGNWNPPCPPLGNGIEKARRVADRLREFAPWVIENVPVLAYVPKSASTTYGWKHIVERSLGTYMSNTEFIVLALALGIPLRLDGLNPGVGVSPVITDLLDGKSRR